MGKIKITIEEANERIEKSQNNTVKIIEYTGMNEKGIFLCVVCNNKWENKSAHDVVNGKRHCPACWNSRKKDMYTIPFSDILSFIKEKDCDYIEGDYVGNKSNLLIRYTCGHLDWVVLDTFKNSKTFLCRKCQKRKIGNQFKASEDSVINLLKAIGLEFIEFPESYLNGKSLVKYKCSKNHVCVVQYDTIKRKRKCTECAIEEQYENRKGDKHPLWNGGTSLISPLIKGNMIEWKKESIKKGNYKCVVTGDRFQAVHHIYSFNMILEEALHNLKIKHKSTVADYTDKELESLIKECKRLHNVYPLGACLRKDIHILFHQIYGKKDNTPEQFYEFIDRINSGEIKINK